MSRMSLGFCRCGFSEMGIWKFAVGKTLIFDGGKKSEAEFTELENEQNSDTDLNPNSVNSTILKILLQTMKEKALHSNPSPKTESRKPLSIFHFPRLREPGKNFQFC